MVTALHCSSRSKSQGVVGSGEVKAEAKARGRTAREGRRAKARSVTFCKPEANVIYTWAGRSRPDGWWRSATSNGLILLGDPRIGVTVQSNLAIAGFLRNVSEYSPRGDG